MLNFYTAWSRAISFLYTKQHWVLEGLLVGYKLLISCENHEIKSELIQLLPLVSSNQSLAITIIHKFIVCLSYPCNILNNAFFSFVSSFPYKSLR